MDLQEKFTAATEQVKTLTKRPTNEQLLSLYSLFKQATEGDVHGDKPGMFDFKAQAKYKAWEKLKGTSSEQAKEKYIALVTELVAAYT
ncbi:MAG: acyl-CoA-binding protein [Bacteroidota bacterium]